MDNHDCLSLRDLVAYILAVVFMLSIGDQLDHKGLLEYWRHGWRVPILWIVSTVTPMALAAYIRSGPRL
jgi:hypothetical protein